MYKITCYKVVLSTEQFIDLSYDEIENLCQYDYAIEVTPEVYYSIKPKKIRFLPPAEGFIAAYYFTKSIEVPS